MDEEVSAIRMNQLSGLMAIHLTVSLRNGSLIIISLIRSSNRTAGQFNNPFTVLTRESISMGLRIA
jgi:hypothetical protein